MQTKTKKYIFELFLPLIKNTSPDIAIHVTPFLLNIKLGLSLMKIFES